MRLVLLLLVIAMTTVAWAYSDNLEHRVVIATSKDLNSPQTRYLTKVYRVAFERLGKSMSLRHCPSKRCTSKSTSLRVDGELSRVYDYQDRHPELVRVSEPHWSSGFIALTLNESLLVDGVDSLIGSDYRIDYKLGSYGSQALLYTLGEPPRLYPVESVELGIKRLLYNRSDMFIVSEMNALEHLSSEKMQGEGLRSAGYVSRFSAHMYLSKDHQEMATNLAKVLREMREEKLLEQYWYEEFNHKFAPTFTSPK